jgi:hypothetical protein
VAVSVVHGGGKRVVSISTGRSTVRRCSLLRPSQQPRQLGDVGGDAPSLVAGEQVGGRTTAGVLLEVDERVAVVVLDEKQEAFASSMSHGGGKRRRASKAGGPDISSRRWPALHRCSVKARPTYRATQVALCHASAFGQSSFL